MCLKLKLLVMVLLEDNWNYANHKIIIGYPHEKYYKASYFLYDYTMLLLQKFVYSYKCPADLNLPFFRNVIHFSHLTNFCKILDIQ